jgi:TonB family protein
MTPKFTIAIAIVISLLGVSVNAQSADPHLNHFSTRGISFDYPAGYAVADESTAEAQKFVITRKGSSIELTIVAMRRLVTQEELPAAMAIFKEPLIQRVGLTLGAVEAARRTAFRTELGSTEAEGVRFRSSRLRKRTGEVIWLRWNNRLVALSFVRADAEAGVGSHLWESVRSSLKVEAPTIGVTTAQRVSTAKPEPAPTGSVKPGSIKGGILNGKARVLPKPVYPDIARAARASGTVVVQILIDEEGNVLSAKAVSGHPLLQEASVAAAREAKFAPTRLSGQPVKVMGVIQYNFVVQ